MKLDVRVIPNARRTRFEGWRNGAPLLRVAAPAKEGKANRAVIRYIAGFFGVPPSAVRLTSGQKSRQKKIEIIGLEPGRAEELLAALRPESGSLGNAKNQRETGIDTGDAVT